MQLLINGDDTDWIDSEMPGLRYHRSRSPSHLERHQHNPMRLHLPFGPTHDTISRYALLNPIDRSIASRLTTSTDCCLNDPQVQNSCFHYCQTDNSGVFPGCVLMNLHVNGSLQVACNTQTATANEASWVVGATSNWKTRLVVVSLAVFAFL